MGIETQLAETAAPTLRTSAGLLRYIPASAIVYVAIPNLDGSIRQALRLFDARARENSVLNDWWSSDQGEELRQTLDRIQAVTPLLGEEVVFILSKKADRAGSPVPLVLAHIQQGREDSVRQAIDRLAGDQGGKNPHRVTQYLLLISDYYRHLAATGALLGGGDSSPFACVIASL